MAKWCHMKIIGSKCTNTLPKRISIDNQLDHLLPTQHKLQDVVNKMDGILFGPGYVNQIFYVGSIHKKVVCGGAVVTPNNDLVHLEMADGKVARQCWKWTRKVRVVHLRKDINFLGSHCVGHTEVFFTSLLRGGDVKCIWFAVNDTGKRLYRV